MGKLTTHDWSAFWVIALGSNQDSYRIDADCAAPAALRKACLLIAEQPSVTADDIVNAEMLAYFTHLVQEHQLTPTKQSIQLQKMLRPLRPQYAKVLKWLCANLPEKRN